MQVAYHAGLRSLWKFEGILIEKETSWTDYHAYYAQSNGSYFQFGLTLGYRLDMKRIKKSQQQTKFIILIYNKLSLITAFLNAVIFSCQYVFYQHDKQGSEKLLKKIKMLLFRQYMTYICHC